HNVANAHVSNFRILQVQVLGVDEKVIRLSFSLGRRIDRPAHRTGQHQEIELAGFIEIERVEDSYVQKRSSTRVGDARQDDVVEGFRHRDVAFRKLGNLAVQEVVPLVIEAKKAH